MVVGPAEAGGAAEERQAARMEAAVRELLLCLGEDVSREGLRKTPQRVVSALRAFTEGYGMSPRDIVRDALFEVASDGMVVVTDIEFHSMCEHHMLPFNGKVQYATAFYFCA